MKTNFLTLLLLLLSTSIFVNQAFGSSMAEKKAAFIEAYDEAFNKGAKEFDAFIEKAQSDGSIMHMGAVRAHRLEKGLPLAPPPSGKAKTASAPASGSAAKKAPVAPAPARGDLMAQLKAKQEQIKSAKPGVALSPAAKEIAALKEAAAVAVDSGAAAPESTPAPTGQGSKGGKKPGKKAAAGAVASASEDSGDDVAADANPTATVPPAVTPDSTPKTETGAVGFVKENAVTIGVVSAAVITVAAVAFYIRSQRQANKASSPNLVPVN